MREKAQLHPACNRVKQQTEVLSRETDELGDLIEGGDQNGQMESEVHDRGTGGRDTDEGDRGSGSVIVTCDRVSRRMDERSTGRVDSNGEGGEDSGVCSKFS